MPRLPWDVLDQIIGANHVPPVDRSLSTMLDLYTPTSELFTSRIAGLEANRAALLVWTKVCRATSVSPYLTRASAASHPELMGTTSGFTHLSQTMASKLLYAVFAFNNVIVLRQVTDVVQANATLASYCHYLCLDREPFHRDGDEDESDDDPVEDANGHQEWVTEMCRLVRLLPNLTTLRGGSGRNVEPLVELLSCPARPLQTIVFQPFTVKSLPIVTALLERSSTTLRSLVFWGPEAVALPAVQSASTYTQLVFPDLRRIDFGYVPLPLLYQLAARWTIPSLDTVEAEGVSCVLPFLEAHGARVEQLGIDTSGLGVTYDRISACCPNLKTLALQVGKTKFDLDVPRRPLASVITINVCRWPDKKVTGEQDSYLPRLVTKKNFPSLARVRYSTNLAGISKAVIAWGRTLTDQGVEVEWV